MREPAPLSDASIIGWLGTHYNLSVAALTFIPLGNDSASFVYRVEAADGASYFLKLRRTPRFSVPSLAVPRYLHDQGIPHVLAPLPTTTKTLWVNVDGFALSLYPFIEGRRAAEVGLSEQQWRAFGALVRQIHACPLTPDLMPLIPRETFTPNQRELIAELEAAVSGDFAADAVQRELAAFWKSKQDVIRAVVDRADALGNQLRQTSAPLVLCHADMHLWNVLLDSAQQFWLVDWDETILALRERDLMFVIGSIAHGLVRPDETAWFLEGYGDIAPDECALVYYRYAWAVQDLAAYGEQVFFLPNVGEQTRREGLQGFMQLFEPGEIISIALDSDSCVEGR